MKAIILLSLLLVGCNGFGVKVASSPSSGILAQQTPGLASGAGATFTGPSNSAGASTQVASRRVGYFQPLPVNLPTPVVQTSVQPVAPDVKSDVSTQVVQPQMQVFNQTPQPAWIDEKVETTYAPHQDAAGIIKVSNILSQWGVMRWIGLLCVFVGYSGILWSTHNPEGYLVVFWKVVACGVVFFVIDASLWWLLLLVIPAGFYLMQKLGLLNIPGVAKLP